MSAQTQFIPGTPANRTELLARFLPPLPQGIVSTWLREHQPLPPRGSLYLLDPFNADPQLPAEAARAGYCVLVAANNPVTRFLLELAADPPTESELRATLADLATIRKGDERLELHIRSLYTTECEQCQRTIMADAFLWEKDAIAPYARIYHCPHCNDSGERPTTPADVAQVNQYSPASLHLARALERVAPAHDPDRAHAEEAISTYLPRAVYALFTILNKVDSLSLTETRRRYLDALLLFALDRSNTLWPYPTARARPRQLVIPSRFRENNIWSALEEAVQTLASTAQAIPCTIWPQRAPESGGITIFEGRLRDLVASVPEVEVSAVITALPRPNQAFWTLSALWAGWLWGREAAAPFKSVLRRRRYDWAWHSTALLAALSNLSSVLPGKTPFLALIGEGESAFLTSSFLAAEMSAFELKGIALQAETGQVQIVWERQEQPLSEATVGKDTLVETTERAAVKGAQSYLLARNEPASYLQLHAAALSEIVSTLNIQTTDDQSIAESYSQVQDMLEGAFSYQNGFLRYGGSGKNPESGQWWLRDPAVKDFPTSILPHADQVEISVVNFLQKNPGCTLPEIEAAVYQQLTGLFTPDPGLIKACLDSYGISDPVGPGTESHGWHLRREDRPSNRRSDLDAMQANLLEIAKLLGLHSEQPQVKTGVARSSLSWLSGSETVYHFSITASAIVGRIIYNPTHPPARSVIVLPGSRAGLVVYKLHRDPRLRLAVESGWRFLKFRQLRWLRANDNLTQEMIAEQLVLDPLAEEDPQMRLL